MTIHYHGPNNQWSQEFIELLNEALKDSLTDGSSTCLAIIDELDFVIHPNKISRLVKDNPGIRVVVISELYDSEGARHCLDNGAHLYIQKSDDFYFLEKNIRQVVNTCH
jgi:DNA-binding NarL/FixJ family response regulator